MNSPSNVRRRAPRLIPALAAITATLALAACGSSSSSSSSTTSASASTSSSANRTALVACLKKHGITPPAHAPTSGTSTAPAGRPPAGSTGAGGANSSARQAAFKACGATGTRFGHSPTTTATTG
jgi:hypothetical protein